MNSWSWIWRCQSRFECPTVLCIKHCKSNYTPSEKKEKSWGKKVKATQVQCTQLQDLCKLCIQHVTTVSANCTEWPHYPDFYNLAFVHAVQVHIWKLYTIVFPLGVRLASATKKKDVGMGLGIFTFIPTFLVYTILRIFLIFLFLPARCITDS